MTKRHPARYARSTGGRRRLTPEAAALVGDSTLQNSAHQRKRRRKRQVAAPAEQGSHGLKLGVFELLTDQPPPPGTNPFLQFQYRELWPIHEAKILAWWVERWPGCRPSTWWEWRRYLPNGAGVRIEHGPDHVEAEATYLRRNGLLLAGELRRLAPADFAVHRRDEDHLNPEVVSKLLAKWIEQHPGTRPDWWWAWTPPTSPRLIFGKRVESDAAYLRRYRMLLPGEEARLSTADFEPCAPFD